MSTEINERRKNKGKESETERVTNIPGDRAVQKECGKQIPITPAHR